MIRRALAATLAALVLVGCVRVPVTGPVERHSPQQQPVNPGVEIAPVPPAAGASPSLIVEGFLHAMATFQPNYPVARQFLTPSANDQWRPDSQVEIYAEGYPPIISAEGAVLTAPMVGTLDAHGAFSPSEGQYHHDFGLVRDAAGEWRISRAPKGLVVSQYLFASTFVRSDVCFWDRTRSWMVPDPRFVPKGGAALAATIRSVLSGPTGRMAPALRPIPNVPLGLDAVSPPSAGVITIDLSPQASALKPEDRRQLLAELMWSVTGRDGIVGVRVRSNSEFWSTASPDGAVTLADVAEVGPLRPDRSSQLYAISDGKPTRASVGGQAIELVNLNPGLSRITSMAVRGDLNEVAAVTEGRTRVRTAPPGEGASQVVLTGTGILDVQYSRFGELWAAGGQPGRDRLMMTADGRRRSVDTSELPQGSIRAFELSPDGVRVAIVLDHQGRRRLGVARIVRTPEAVFVDGWHDLAGASWGQVSPVFLDVGWVTASQLMVLVSTAASTRVVQIDSDGALATDVGPNDATTLVSLTVQPGASPLVRSGGGDVFRFGGQFDWSLILSKVSDVTYPT